MGEAALRQQVGGTDVMREQIDHLQELSTHPKVTLQVIPYVAGAHAGLVMPSFMESLKLPHPRLSTVYVEGYGSKENLFLDSDQDLASHEEIFNQPSPRRCGWKHACGTCCPISAKSYRRANSWCRRARRLHLTSSTLGKSTSGDYQTACVEAADRANGAAVRDSKHRDLGAWSSLPPNGKHPQAVKSEVLSRSGPCPWSHM